MKNRKIIGLIATIMIAAVAAWNISFGAKTDRLSDIALANIEALAENEYQPGLGWDCFQNVQFNGDYSLYVYVYWCGDCWGYPATQISGGNYCCFNLSPCP